MDLVILQVDILTDGAGAFTGFTDAVSGRVEFVKFTNGAGGDALHADTDITLTALRTGQTIWSRNNSNSAVTLYPRHSVQTSAGADFIYSTSNPVAEPFYLFGESIRVVVADGDNGKSGTVEIGIDRSF